MMRRVSREPCSGLLRRSRLFVHVLELWSRQNINTTAIAEMVGASEAEVCAIIDEAEGRGEKFGGVRG